MHPEIDRRERIVRVIVGEEAKRVVLIGERGTVLSGRVSAETAWDREDLLLVSSRAAEERERPFREERFNVLALLEEDRIVAAAFDHRSNKGWILSRFGQLFVTRDYGQSWDRKQLIPGGGGIVPGRFVRWRVVEVLAVVTNATRDRSLAVTNDGQVFVFTDYGKNWKRAEISWNEDEIVTTAAFGVDSEYALLAGNRGTVIVVAPNGEELHRSVVDVKQGEFVVRGALTDDAKDGLLVTNEGSVFTRVDGGVSWDTTRWDRDEVPASTVVLKEEVDQGATGLVLTKSGAVHLLIRHTDLAEWEDLLRRGELENVLSGNQLVRDSRIYREMAAFLGAMRVPIKDKTSQPEPSNGPGGWFGDVLDDLTVMRIVTLTVLFFLVHVLVRLYQYNTRLAGFCESRADAILLAETFASSRRVAFDDLVRVFGPDGYDFKSMPRSTWMWPVTRPS